MKNNAGTCIAVAREVFEATSGMEAAMRNGRNPQLKGVVHETMYKNAYNLSPARIIDGKEAVLSKSVTAVRDDVLIKQGGKIVERLQLKDTPASIGNTIKQVSEKHYAGTNLVGTKETVNAYSNAVKKAAESGKAVTQKMSSSGISSADTSRVAAKTIGSSAGKITAGSLGSVAASSGLVGAAISGGIEVISSGIKLASEEIEVEEFVGNVAKETVGGGLSAAGGSIAASVVGAGLATALVATTAPLWIAPVGACVAALATGSVIKWSWDSFWE